MHVNDLLWLAIIAYSLIVEHLYGITGSALWWYFFVAFLVPIVVKIGWFVWAVDGWQRQLQRVRLMLVKCGCVGEGEVSSVVLSAQFKLL